MTHTSNDADLSIGTLVQDMVDVIETIIPPPPPSSESTEEKPQSVIIGHRYPITIYDVAFLGL